MHLTQGATILDPKGTKSAGDRSVFRDGLLISARYLFMSYKEALDFDSLYKGLTQCCRSVRWKDSVVGYENNGLKNTYKLRKDLLNGTYQISKYQRFKVFEPKERDIVATRIRDRQFQRTLCDSGLYEMMTKSFIHDSGACLEGRGVDYTLDRMTKHLRRYNIEHGRDGWVLKCDIRHYFQSIPHGVAKAAIRKRVPDKEIADKACDIVDSFGGDKGIGLGSQVSQLIALAVLDDLDHYIKERLRIKHYIRYMDDFILVHPDKEYLKTCRKIIELKLEELGLELNEKTKIYPLKQGVKLLQWRFRITPSGKILRRMNKNKSGKQRRKLKKLFRKELEGKYKSGTAKESLISFLANASRGDTYFVRRRMTYFYIKQEEYFNEQQRQLERTGKSGSSRCSSEG